MEAISVADADGTVAFGPAEMSHTRYSRVSPLGLASLPTGNPLFIFKVTLPPPEGVQVHRTFKVDNLYDLYLQSNAETGLSQSGSFRCRCIQSR